MRPDVLSALSLLAVALLHAITSARVAGSGAGALALVLPLLVRSRADLGLFTQRVGVVLAAGAGGVLAFVEAPEAVSPLLLSRGWSVMAVAALFGAAFRSWVRAPEGGPLVTFLLGLAGLVAAGEIQTGPVFPVFVVAYLTLGLLAIRAGDAGRPAAAQIGLRGWLSSAGLLALAAAVTVGLSIALPPLGLRVRDRILASFGPATTGLGERMVLGSLEGMRESDVIVARVHGPPIDYLRAVVYDHYQAGQWATSSAEGTRTAKVPRAGLAGEPHVRIEIFGAGRPGRYFAPLGATSVAVPEGQIVTDRFGALRPVPDATRVIELSPAPAWSIDDEITSPGGGPLPAGDFPPAYPTQDDLRRPVKLARRLSPIVHEWTQAVDTPEARVAAIAAHLRENYTYSLRYDRAPGDPLVDFLERSREGHCEYFASALAMLSRGAGIPARVVAGYRVVERNELGDYSIVRERDAHAWVEVFIEGRGWITADATPEDPSVAERAQAMPLFAALWDLARVRFRAYRDDPSAPGLPELIVTLLVVVVVGLVVRWWTQRRRVAASAALSFFETEGPPRALVRLEAALARRGLRRGPEEPIERFAERLRDGGAGVDSAPPSDAPAPLEEASALLLEYSAFRYGGVGDGPALLARMEEAAARVSSAGT